MSTHRKAAVAGFFYPAEASKLKKQISELYSRCDLQKAKKAFALISPHAGYIYSGQVAADVFSKVKITKKIFILSPNHTGEGAAISINAEGSWETPLGEVKIDSALAKAFMKHCPWVEEDEEAHREEHSLEVQLPFLQYLKKDFEFVPLTLQHLSYEDCEVVGMALAEAMREYQRQPQSGDEGVGATRAPMIDQEVLILASSDMNHYESHERTLKKDMIAIDPILKMDPKKLYEQVHQHDVSMCGIIPATIALIATKLLGAKHAELISHTTSGPVSGDYERVVGYASFIIS